MKTRSSVPYRRNESYNRRNDTPWVGAGVALAFAAAPLMVMLWVVPITGLGIA